MALTDGVIQRCCVRCYLSLSVNGAHHLRPRIQEPSRRKGFNPSPDARPHARPLRAHLTAPSRTRPGSDSHPHTHAHTNTNTRSSSDYRKYVTSSASMLELGATIPKSERDGEKVRENEDGEGEKRRMRGGRVDGGAEAHSRPHTLGKEGGKKDSVLLAAVFLST